MLQGRNLFAVLCLVGYSHALVDYEHAVHHIAKVIQDHHGDFMHGTQATAHQLDMTRLKEKTCHHFEPNHHQIQECYTIFELDPCKHYLDDEGDYYHC